ncbi:MAG: RICIN domain-containing protein [Proteobacteria bacterium]|nr:RICIN domain-containing protein [Pseudomonadota bacterium]
MKSVIQTGSIVLVWLCFAMNSCKTRGDVTVDAPKKKASQDKIPEPTIEPSIGGTLPQPVQPSSEDRSSDKVSPVEPVTPVSPTVEPTPVKPIAPAKGDVSKLSWQFYYKKIDKSEVCIEAESTQEGSALLGKPCLPVSGAQNQVFKTERFADGLLLVEQRTQNCLAVKDAVLVDGALIVLQACKRAGEKSELFEFVDAEIDTGFFKIRNVKSRLCLKALATGKVAQSSCTALETYFSTKP